MNTKDIIAMAIESHLVMADYDHSSLEAFAALVASAERDKVLEEVAHEFDCMRIAFGDTAHSFASYVRDMKNAKTETT